MTRLDNPTPVSIHWTPDGRIDLFALTRDGVRPLGRHATPRDAWRAIDELDMAPVPAGVLAA